ncbi:hypothetical protein [Powai lake megavirus]|uniref:Uncharacterized protein n=1 Tax=Powai lake megavirus TaxID=1842663 RepID=A0A167RK52_9VIRU|nr:hypothetical protein QJ849_gp619 [Powai lake megavirus]ANB50781.1 hypothetical protein [Powai lake megavirus]
MTSTQVIEPETNEKQVFDEVPETVTLTDKQDDSPYSPKSGADRLAKLPQNVYDEFKKLSYGQAFGAFVDRLHNDVNSENFEHYHLLWIKIVYNMCISFQKRNFYVREPAVTLSDDFKKCIQQTAILDIVQTFIDFAQQDGNTENTKNYREANYYRNLYKSFVRLYHQCNGTWGFTESKPGARRQNSGSRYNSKSSSRNNGQYARGTRSHSYKRNRNYNDEQDDEETNVDHVTRPSRFDKSDRVTRTRSERSERPERPERTDRQDSTEKRSGVSRYQDKRSTNSKTFRQSYVPKVNQRSTAN